MSITNEIIAHKSPLNLRDVLKIYLTRLSSKLPPLDLNCLPLSHLPAGSFQFSREQGSCLRCSHSLPALGNSSQGWARLVDCPTQLTLGLTWICQLSRRWDPSKGGSKIFGASLRPGKDIWRQFLCKIYTVCPYKLITCKQNASKKAHNLLKTAVSAGRQSHPRNEEQACSKSHMDFSGSDLHISH